MNLLEKIKQLNEKKDKFQKELNAFVEEMESVEGCIVLIQEFSEANQKFNIGLAIDMNKI